MRSLMLELPIEEIQPLYSIRRFTEEIYKITKFNGSGAFFCIDHSNDKHHDSKLDSSFSRARARILEIALCNHWTYFFTGTFNPGCWDRFDLDLLHKSLTQFFRDLRKKYHHEFRFLLIPEQHKDGAIHFHGLLDDLPKSCLASFDPLIHPISLCKPEYFRFLDFERKFGFSSLCSINSPVACAFYMCKYISKDLSKRKDEIGKHLYSCSQGLKSSIDWAKSYIPDPDLDKFIDHHYEFCSTGYTKVKDGCDWTFGSNCEPSNLLPLFSQDELDLYDKIDHDTINYYQMSIFGGIV